MKKLILASKSPRRKQLLELANVDFEIITRDTDESFPFDMDVESVPIYIANKKAQALKDGFPNRKILAADTVVVLNHVIIGKPQNRQDAISILRALSGNTHQVITGVCILEEEKTIEFSEITEVEFHTLSQTQIEYYVDHFQPYDKAGAYAIQEWIGAIGIKRINGCYYNVMGLPISKLISFL